MRANFEASRFEESAFRSAGGAERTVPEIGALPFRELDRGGVGCACDHEDVRCFVGRMQGSDSTNAGAKEGTGGGGEGTETNNEPLEMEGLGVFLGVA